MKITVGIKELSCKALIGCLDVEQKMTQDVNVTIEGVYDMTSLIETRNQDGHRDLEKAIDYCEIKELCLETLKAPFSLLEVLAYELQENLKKAFPQFEALTITLEKPHAFRGKDYPFVSLKWEK